MKDDNENDNDNDNDDDDDNENENDNDLPVLDQGVGEEDGGLSSGLHTDLVDQAGVLAGQTVGGEE